MQIKTTMADTSSSNSAIDPLKNKKRTRCNNFTQYEKDVLVSLIESHQEIIASKRTDKSTLEEKENVWRRVTSDFNSILGYDLHNNAGSQHRTARSLKYCYENLKRKLKDSQEIIVMKKDGTSDNDHEGVTDSCTRLTFHDDSVESRASGNIGYINRSQVPTNNRTNKIFLKSRINKTLSRRLKIKRNSNNIITNLKIKLLKKELELKDFELEMKKKLGDLELQTEKAKLDFYERKKEMFERQYEQCKASDM